jgi:hypothetical protein
MRHRAYREGWWTKARVIEGMRRFYRDHKFAPTSTEEWHRLTKGTGKSRSGVGNPYPSFNSVLKYFSSFRQAWTAAGVEVNRDWEPWTPEEDSFIVEGAGILTRNELAEALDRTPNAVHRRLYDLGVNTRNARGWTFHRVMTVTGCPDYILRRYANRGDLPYFRGTRLVYIDPADLLVVKEIDWNNAPEDLAEAVRRSLMGRLVKILTGQDWRAGRLYQPHKANTTDKKHQKRNPPPPVPRPNGIDAGDRVRLLKRAAKTLPNASGLESRLGLVHVVYWSAYGSQSNHRRGRDDGGAWVARVEFKGNREKNLPRLQRVLPLAALRISLGRAETQQ